MRNHPAPGNGGLVPHCPELDICTYTHVYRIHILKLSIPNKKISRIISYAFAQRMFLKHLHVKWEFRMMWFSLISAGYEAFA